MVRGMEVRLLRWLGRSPDLGLSRSIWAAQCWQWGGWWATFHGSSWRERPVSAPQSTHPASPVNLEGRVAAGNWGGCGEPGPQRGHCCQRGEAPSPRTYRGEEWLRGPALSSSGQLPEPGRTLQSGWARALPCLVSGDPQSVPLPSSQQGLAPWLCPERSLLAVTAPFPGPQLYCRPERDLSDSSFYAGDSSLYANIWSVV